MTPRTIVIPLHDEVSILTHRLIPYLGESPGVSHQNNYLPTLELAVASVLSFDSWGATAAMIQEYGVDDEAAQDLAVEIRNSVVNKIHQTLGQVQEFHDYDFYISRAGDVWLTDHGHNEKRHQAHVMEDYIEKLRESHYNGDYLPAHERRLIGV